ncbi:haloacid dehalogenase, partial [Streptomyces sp. MK37H]|nr:haloacid dehalogenase [Streptomyces sp. MK37H]
EGAGREQHGRIKTCPTSPRVPDAAEGTLTADLGRAVRLAKVSPEWTRTRPASHEVRTSLDGRHWREGTTGPARFVRVTVRSADDKKRAGMEELRVTRAK